MAPHLWVFLAASLALAMFPGPSILFVSARALIAGRAEGASCCLGTGLGGMVHVLAATLGLSALLLASARLFALLKFAGALYLLWMGLGIIRAAGITGTASPPLPVLGLRLAFGKGILVEALNPKTALFFLAFLPQFIAPAEGHIARQFLVLGLIAVVLNTGADLSAAMAAARLRAGFAAAGGALVWGRRGLGAVLVLLGAELAFTTRP
jgi:threonine/homoserine/homoserine lactone efflux protein